MALSPDGSVIYQPSFEKDHWLVLNAADGDVIATITPKSKAHNTVYGPDGRWCYLAGLGSPLLTVADTSTHTAARTIGPFGHVIRPFTVNGSQTRCYVCVNGLLGFEVGDITTGKKLCRVEVEGFEQGPVKRHGCPSHGIGLTPDETEVWVCDAHNQQMHLRQHRFPARTGGQHRAAGRAGLDHVQPRWHARLALHGGRDRRPHPRDHRPSYR